MARIKAPESAIAPESTAGIGLRILQVRKEQGLSQAALAESIARSTRTRTSKSLVSQWETSRVADPKNPTLQAIAVALGVSPRWLATGKGNRTEAAPPVDLRRAVRVACNAIDGQDLEPDALAAAISEVMEILSESPTSPDNVLCRVARLAYRSRAEAS